MADFQDAWRAVLSSGWRACVNPHVEVRSFSHGDRVARQLVLVAATFAEGNRQVAEYTVGMDTVGTGQPCSSYSRTRDRIR